MKIQLTVKTNARKNEVESLGENEYKVSVSVPPVEGKANERIIEFLSEYFNNPKRSISIVRGNTSKTKTVEIL